MFTDKNRPKVTNYFFVIGSILHKKIFLLYLQRIKRNEVC